MAIVSGEMDKILAAMVLAIAAAASDVKVKLFFLFGLYQLCVTLKNQLKVKI